MALPSLRKSWSSPSCCNSSVTDTPLGRVHDDAQQSPRERDQCSSGGSSERLRPIGVVPESISAGRYRRRLARLSPPPHRNLVLEAAPGEVILVGCAEARPPQIGDERIEERAARNLEAARLC